MSEMKISFEGGMHSNNDPSLQPQGTYRRLLNGNLFTMSGNNFSIESVAGNIISFTLPNVGFTPICFADMPDKLVILSTNDFSSGGAAEIGEVTMSTDGIGVYVPLYHHIDFEITMAHQAEGFCLLENNYIQRFYWTDNYNPPRVLNIANKKLKNYFATGALVTGTEYMVLTGTVTHNAVVYGPLQVAGTVFTKTAAVATYAGSPLVIEYIKIGILEWTPRKYNGTIDFSSLTAGTLTGGMYCYVYQLEGDDGVRSSWSYVSRPMHVGQDGYSAYVYGDYSQYHGVSNSTNTNKGITITISDIDTNWKKIRVAFIKFTALNIAALPILFYEGLITGSSMDISHHGGENLLALTFADIQEIFLGIKTVKTIAPVQNRNAGGNWSEYGKIGWDATSATIESIPYLVPSDEASGVYGKTYPIYPYPLIGQEAVATTPAIPYTFYPKIYTDAKYKVNGTNNLVDWVIYDGTKYGPGQPAGIYFTGVIGVHVFSLQNGIPYIIPVILIQKYTNVYREIIINDTEWYDTKGRTVQTHLMSYWRGEKYRFALVPYDLLGNPMFALFIGDFTFPEQYTSGGLTYNPRLCERNIDDYGTNADTLSLRHLGIKVSDVDFNLALTAIQEAENDLTLTLDDLDKYISGFSIVRAPRQKQILAQGLLWPTILEGGLKLHPSAMNQLGNDKNFNTTGHRHPNVYTFYSPEHLFGYPGVSLVSGDYLKLVDYYSPGNLNGADPIYDTYGLEISDDHFYLKFYQQESAVNTPKGTTDGISTTIGGDISVAATNVGIGMGIITFYNQTLADDANCTAIPSVADGTNNWLGGNDRVGNGGKTKVFALDQAEGAGIFTDGFGDHSQWTIKKPLCNWIRSNDNSYGGTSDSALENMLYIYCDHYQKLDAAFIAYIKGNGGKADDIEVFGGDAYVSVFDFARMIKNNKDEDGGSPIPQFSSSMFFPVESNINLGLREGVCISRNWSSEGTTNNGGVSYDGPPNPEQFSYNGAYSSQESTFFYNGLPVGFTSNNKFPYLGRYSLEKLAGELIDNFRIWLPGNFKFAEGIHGQINNVLESGTRLFYLQDRGVGYFPILDREQVTGALGDAIQIGAGTVMNRFDNLDKFHGNQHQWGVIRIPGKWVWYDLKRREMMVLSYNGETAELDRLKEIDIEIKNIFDAIDGIPGTTIFNSDQPILGRGISAGYDYRFGMGFITFKFMNANESKGDLTLGLNKDLNKFVGWYSFAPGIWFQNNGHLLGSLRGGTYSDLKDVYVWWRGDICKFFGEVFEHYVDVIAAADREVGFDSAEVYGNDIPYTDVICTTENGLAQDTNIQSTNRFYKFLRGSWLFSLPLQNRKLLSDHWMKMRLRVQNYITGAKTVSLNQKKRTVNIKMKVREKK